MKLKDIIEKAIDKVDQKEILKARRFKWRLDYLKSRGYPTDTILEQSESFIDGVVTAIKWMEKPLNDN
jgi:hypothetical protein